MYVPPDRRLCEDFDSPVDLGTGLDRLYWCQSVYRKKVVHFSIEQHARWREGDDWITIYRQDTSHGSIHEHIFQQDGTCNRRILEVIPDEGWDFVNVALPVALDQLERGWQERRRRWDTS